VLFHNFSCRVTALLAQTSTSFPPQFRGFHGKLRCRVVPGGYDPRRNWLTFVVNEASWKPSFGAVLLRADNETEHAVHVYRQPCLFGCMFAIPKLTDLELPEIAMNNFL
jgi:hypothetical protein